MRLFNQSDYVSLNKIRQYSQVQTQLARLKRHVLHRKKIFNQTQLNNIFSQIKVCESYFDKKKKQMIHQQAHSILTRKSPPKQSVKYFQPPKPSLTIEQPEQFVSFDQHPCEVHYQMKLNTCSTEHTDAHLIFECEIIPDQLVQPAIKMKKNEINTQNSTSKQCLTKFPYLLEQAKRRLSHHKNQSTNIQYNILNRDKSTHNVKKQQLIRQKSQNLRDNRLEEIRGIKKGKMQNKQKNILLEHLTKKYAERAKNGNDEALDLMCLASLTRADILLQQ